MAQQNRPLFHKSVVLRFLFLPGRGEFVEQYQQLLFFFVREGFKYCFEPFVPLVGEFRASCLSKLRKHR